MYRRAPIAPSDVDGPGPLTVERARRLLVNSGAVEERTAEDGTADLFMECSATFGRPEPFHLRVPHADMARLCRMLAADPDLGACAWALTRRNDAPDGAAAQALRLRGEWDIERLRMGDPERDQTRFEYADARAGEILSGHRSGPMTRGPRQPCVNRVANVGVVTGLPEPARGATERKPPQRMPRYIVIKRHDGGVYGDTGALQGAARPDMTPAEAVCLIDRSLGRHERGFGFVRRDSASAALDVFLIDPKAPSDRSDPQSAVRDHGTWAASLITYNS